MFTLPLEGLVSRAVAGAVPHGRFCRTPPGGRVHLVCRDHSRAEGARTEIIRESGNQVSGSGPLLRGLPARGARQCGAGLLARLLLPELAELWSGFCVGGGLSPQKSCSHASQGQGRTQVVGEVTPTPSVKACLGDMAQTGPCRGPSPEKEAVSLRHVQGDSG